MCEKCKMRQTEYKIISYEGKEKGKENVLEKSKEKTQIIKLMDDIISVRGERESQTYNVE